MDTSVACPSSRLCCGIPPLLHSYCYLYCFIEGMNMAMYEWVHCSATWCSIHGHAWSAYPWLYTLDKKITCTVDNTLNLSKVVMCFIIRGQQGRFRRVRKISISDCYLRRDCPFVRVEQLGFSGRIFIKFGIWVFYQNLSWEFKFH